MELCRVLSRFAETNVATDCLTCSSSSCPPPRQLLVNQSCNHLNSDDKGLSYVRFCFWSHTRRKCIFRSDALRTAVAALSYAPKEESRLEAILIFVYSFDEYERCSMHSLRLLFLSFLFPCHTFFGLFSLTPLFSTSTWESIVCIMSQVI